MPSTSIVVPCFNEAQRLVVEELISHVAEHTGHEFLFVDDGSTDDTFEVLCEMCAHRPESLRCLKLTKNFGKAEAVRLGIIDALSRDPEFVGYWDADMATPLSAIADFLEIFSRQSEVQLVTGSRVRLLGRHIERRPLRHYLGRVFATFASMMLGVDIYDTQCGAKLFRVSENLRPIFEEPFRVNWTFDVELLARFIRQVCHSNPTHVKLAIHEFPLWTWTDVAGSKVRPRDFFKAIVEMTVLWWRY